MVFKRRDKRSFWQIIAESLYPRGGWSRAVKYVRHRLNRLPDSPDRISRGIFAGVVTAFTPLFGLHFVIAFLLAKLLRGNVLAAVMSTFFGNPLTYVPIAVVSMRTGSWMLGKDMSAEVHHGVMRSFGRASEDLWDNFVALFTAREAHWDRLFEFFDQVFYPYLIGGIIPGVIAGLVCYYLSVPVIRAYQKRRSKRLKSKLETRRKKARMLADALRKSD